MFQDPPDPPDELARNVSKKKSRSDELFLHESSESYRFSFIFTIRIRFFGPGELNQNALGTEQYLMFFHPEIKRTVYYKIPEEDKTEGEDQVGELLKTMHGTRDASAEWEGYCSEVFESAVAKFCLFSPCFFVQEQTKVNACVHGDDMCLEGKRGCGASLGSETCANCVTRSGS